jgi:tRNA pseudouridine38-40 synthase
MRRLRLTLGYRGTHYAGWAVQNRSHLPTVQACVESALASALGHQVRVTAAGRTDAGVHASGQVVSFDTSSTISSPGLRRVIARSLPDDIWVMDADEVGSTFDARRSAVRRWYRYAIWRSAAEPPTEWHGRCLVHREPLDPACMREASRALLGRHDFGSFVTRPSKRGSTERTVFVADWLEVSRSLLLFEICADGYLKQMVRTIGGRLLWVGSGRWTPEQFASALPSADRRAAGPNAPAVGLTLHRIEY